MEAGCILNEVTVLYQVLNKQVPVPVPVPVVQVPVQVPVLNLQAPVPVPVHNLQVPVPVQVLCIQCRINANRGPWQLFARGPLLTRDKMSKTNLNCR